MVRRGRRERRRRAAVPAGLARPPRLRLRLQHRRVRCCDLVDDRHGKLRRLHERQGARRRRLFDGRRRVDVRLLERLRERPREEPFCRSVVDGVVVLRPQVPEDAALPVQDGWRRHDVVRDLRRYRWLMDLLVYRTIQDVARRHFGKRRALGRGLVVHGVPGPLLLGNELPKDFNYLLEARLALGPLVERLLPDPRNHVVQFLLFRRPHRPLLIRQTGILYELRKGLLAPRLVALSRDVQLEGRALAVGDARHHR